MKAMLALNARGGKEDKISNQENALALSEGNPQAGTRGPETSWDMVGQTEMVPQGRRSRNAGMHTIEIYFPQFYFTQVDMEEYDARPDRYGPTVIGKYTKGIGQVEARFPSDDEDPISFAMTVVHRLLERMEAKGINETGNYMPNGQPLSVWNAIGRIDIGTESIQDRSKSMKSYIMDIFERYANESNIEGVDQYNACYGGQACGLCTLSWVESDRWDGRYGIAVATDISEAHPGFMAFVGAATTAALFFPDAPMSHHSQRASCVLHRFDFCKPVGWHDMAPITDGKYSVECYLDALDACHSTLRQKLNGRGPLEVTDLNVFHTGGGYHIVRKAFERLVRAENKGIKPDEKERLLQEKLMPSVALLKIIGPCHTVSSFLNTGSVIMNKMEQALGKIILVFTYGSGCAASMYQMRVDDVPFFDPFEIWKLQFYRNAIKVTPEESVPLHHYYVQTWMKFDYFPQGRRTCKISLWKYEEDAYYLMQIDKFGRRFYHRGGLSSGPMDPSLKLPVDKAEERPTRESWGPVLVRPEEKTVKAITNKPSKEDRFKEIEYAMAFGDTEDARFEEISEVTDRYNPNQKVTIRKPIEREITLEPDGDSHSYQIVGTWSGHNPEEMSCKDDTWTFEITLGENRWESFYLIQDNDFEKRIMPNVPKANKEAVPVGPLNRPKHEWLLDCRARVNVPEEQVGLPGEKYLITFRWEKLKEITWEKLPDVKGEVLPGKYYLTGPFNGWNLVEMEVDTTGPRRRRKGWFSTEVQVSSLPMEFCVVRNEDFRQAIYPEVLPGPKGPKVSQHSAICGPDDGDGTWKIEDLRGAVYKIFFFRDPEDCEPSSMRIDWKKVEEERSYEEPEAAYYINSQLNDFNHKLSSKMTLEAVEGDTKNYVGEVMIQELPLDPKKPTERLPSMPFNILLHRLRDHCLHPDQDMCTQETEHGILLDENSRNCWCIGKNREDDAYRGDLFTIRLTVTSESYSISWSKAQQ